MDWQTIVWLLVAGGLGALIRLIVRDKSLELPYIQQGKFYVGFIGALIIGAGVGFAVDGSFVAAFLAGYTGSSLIDKLAFDNKIKYPEIK